MDKLYRNEIEKRIIDQLSNLKIVRRSNVIRHIIGEFIKNDLISSDDRELVLSQLTVFMSKIPHSSAKKDVMLILDRLVECEYCNVYISYNANQSEKYSDFMPLGPRSQNGEYPTIKDPRIYFKAIYK